MTKTCPICGKGRNRAWRRIKLRGKYNPTVKHTQRPNLQWMRLPSGPDGIVGAGRRIKACTKCMKAVGKSK